MHVAQGARQCGAHSCEGHHKMVHVVMEASDMVYAVGEGHGNVAHVGARTWQVGAS